MIPEDALIEPGLKVRHDEGLLYEVQDVRFSTERWEATRRLGPLMVNYVQLESGEHYPAGTQWNKPATDFRKYFTAVEAE